MLELSEQERDEQQEELNALYEPQPDEVERIPVRMWTDGACSGNPGAGGYAAILKAWGREYEKTVTGGLAQTTNNQMECAAVRAGLQALKRPCRVTVYTDSRLVIGWLRDDWRRNDPECRAILEEIDALIKQGEHILEFEQVKGHSGDEMNERCDELARGAIVR